MKKLLVSIVAVLTLVAFSSMAIAAEAPKTEPAKVEAKAETKAEMKAETITGKIVKIEKAKNEIVIKEKKGEKTLVLKPEEIEKLKVGEEVKLEVEKGTNKVEKIEMMKKK
jgi:hypothetical protein